MSTPHPNLDHQGALDSSYIRRPYLYYTQMMNAMRLNETFGLILPESEVKSAPETLVRVLKHAMEGDYCGTLLSHRYEDPTSPLAPKERALRGYRPLQLIREAFETLGVNSNGDLSAEGFPIRLLLTINECESLEGWWDLPKAQRRTLNRVLGFRGQGVFWIASISGGTQEEVARYLTTYDAMNEL